MNVALKLKAWFWSNKLFAFSSLYVTLFFLAGILGYILPESKPSRIPEKHLISPTLGKYVLVTRDGFVWERKPADFKPGEEEWLMRNPQGDALTLGPYFFGTDEAGRDVALRILISTKAYLLPSFIAVLISMILGIPLGIMSSDIWAKSWVKAIPQGIMDMLEAMPKYITILLAIIIIPIGIRDVRIGFFNWQLFYWLSMLLGVLNTPKIGKLIVERVNALEKREFIESAMSMGISKFSVAAKHVLRYNCLPLFITQAALLVTEVIFIEITLAYLSAESNDVWGIDVTEGWGNILITERPYLLNKIGWWITLFPIIAIVLSVLMINLFGHSLIGVLTKERTATEL